MFITDFLTTDELYIWLNYYYAHEADLGGIKYSFDDQMNQINASYSIKKLYNTFLHTGQISYVRYFQQYNFSIIPGYSFNKFNYE